MFVLCYHSHNISGADYSTNDHVAFREDLETLTRLGLRIVPLTEIVARMKEGRGGAELVGLSFDDGPVFDYEDFSHPAYGPQRSFFNIMRDFIARHGGDAQPGMHATSFVIASPGARGAMERADECGYTYLEDWLNDRWWRDAAASGILDVGNHSWDHVHGAPQSVVVTSGKRGDFTVVDNDRDAASEIEAANEYIEGMTEKRCTLFAYPFGHVNGYLTKQYFPQHGHRFGLEAAFGTGGRRILRSDSVWDIPRAVCGHHWRSSDQLVALLSA